MSTALRHAPAKCRPIEAVFLALDPAKHTSGACTLIPDYGNGMLDEDPHPFQGSYYLGEWGKVESQTERRRFLEEALEEAEEARLPLVIVAENWDPPRHRKVRLPEGGWGLVMDAKWTYTTILGIGEGWGLWQAEIEAANEALREEGKPPILVVRATPNTWRRGLWERPPKHHKELKELAYRHFALTFGFAVQQDVADAGCIGLWATTAVEIEEAVQAWHKAAPKKKKRSAKKR